jgi:hypothetical protein
MNSGLNDASSVLVAAFKAALLHQGLVALLILAVLAVAWVSVREWIPSVRTAAGSGGSARARTGTAEPAGRRLLRIGFGIIWVFDGLLQAQPRMAAGLPSAAIEPAAASSPHWVQHLVNWAALVSTGTATTAVIAAGQGRQRPSSPPGPVTAAATGRSRARCALAPARCVLC